MEARNTTAVVTGAASGIGRALAQRLKQRGADLTVADRDAEALQAVADDLDAHAVTMDVSRAGDNDRLAASVDTPAVLCLNAGVLSTAPGPVWEAAPDEWRRVLDINLGGVVNGLRAFVPRMLATGREHRILITASLAGLATWPGGGPYAASKHAVVTVAEQAALALADHRVAITVLCPALVRTGMSDEGEDPGDVAGAALDAADRGLFTVVPTEWTQAVRQRSSLLADGGQPRLPSPQP